MNPVVGIDVAKEVSEVQAFLEKGKAYGKDIVIEVVASCILHSCNELKRISL